MTSARSTRFLYGLSTLALVVGLVAALFLVGSAAFGVGSEAVSVHTRVPADRLANMPQGAVAPDEVDVAVRVHDASAAQKRLFSARDLGPVVVVLAIIWLLRALLKSVRDADPFTDVNVKRLRTIGALVLIGIPVATFVSSLCASELASTAGLAGPPVAVGMPGSVLIGGLALFVLAEVFAGGVRMRDELEGTV